jgi:prevent-host-death family protein
MITVSALEAKTRLGKLLDRVARGEEIVITRHEKPIARMIPEGQRRLVVVQQAVTELRRLQERIRARTKGRGRLSDSEVRSAIDEGRL